MLIVAGQFRMMLISDTKQYTKQDGKSFTISQVYIGNLLVYNNYKIIFVYINMYIIIV